MWILESGEILYTEGVFEFKKLLSSPEAKKEEQKKKSLIYVIHKQTRMGLPTSMSCQSFEDKW